MITKSPFDNEEVLTFTNPYKDVETDWDKFGNLFNKKYFPVKNDHKHNLTCAKNRLKRKSKKNSKKR